jgi:hypothetical protein
MNCVTIRKKKPANKKYMPRQESTSHVEVDMNDTTDILEILKRQFSLFDGEIVESIYASFDNDEKQAREKLQQLQSEKDQEHINDIIDMAEQVSRQTKNLPLQREQSDNVDRSASKVDSDLLQVIQGHIHDFFTEPFEEPEHNTISPIEEVNHNHTQSKSKQQKAPANIAINNPDSHQTTQIVIIRKKTNKIKIKEKIDIQKYPEKSPPIELKAFSVPLEIESYSTCDDQRQISYIEEDDYGPAPYIDQESIGFFIRSYSFFGERAIE